MQNKMEIIKEIANSCASSLGIEIVSVEFVNEFGMRILRVIARKEPSLTIDDASELNRLISDELDKVDLIEEEYYLEVSSEGLERELVTDEEIKNAIGKYICVKLYQKVNGKKEFFGDLLNYENDQLTLKVVEKGRRKDLVFQKSMIAKVRLAIKF